MDSNPDIRVGDAERTDALERLSELFADGYFTVTEFDERSAAVVTATYRGDIAQQFQDLPDTREIREPGVNDSSATGNELVRSYAAQEELDRIHDKGAKVLRADAIIWSVVMLTFFLGLFVFQWPWFWAAFPIGAFASWGARGIFGLNDEDEKLYDELSKAETEQRQERLRIAMEKHKELGQ